MSLIIERVQELLVAEPDPERYYYAVTLLSLPEGRSEYSCYSGWIGFTEDKPRREIREASLVHADRVVGTWRKAGQTALVVNSIDDLCLFFGFGGNAVVEKGVANEIIPEWLAPHTVASVGEFGFSHIEALPSSALQRAPTPKHRMRILQRDKFRCRVCGRSPNDHVDLELHVHYIRPWAVGGVTEDSNLITLCHTCHNGLDPHFEFSLFKLLPQKDSSERTAEYLRRLQSYQAEAVQRWQESDV